MRSRRERRRGDRDRNFNLRAEEFRGEFGIAQFDLDLDDATILPCEGIDRSRTIAGNNRPDPGRDSVQNLIE